MSSKPGSPLAEVLLIVPAAHTRVANVGFQTELYELFHRTRGARAGHMIGTPAVLFGTLLLASRASGAAAPALASGLVLALAAWGVAVDRLAGIATGVAAALLAGGALTLGNAVGGETALRVGLACVFGGCVVQTFSHVFEDVPPPLSGGPGFVPVGTWRRRVGAREVLRVALLTVVVYFWLELWASFRILPLQLLHLLMRAGHRPDLRRALDARIAAILSEPASGWRRPGAAPGGGSALATEDAGGAR